MTRPFRCRTGAALCAFGLVALLAAPGRAGEYKARVTQVDRTQFPQVAVYLSVTDAKGQPVPASADLSVEVSEGGELVHQGPLFGPQERAAKPEPTAVVLVIDCSGSMEGPKMEQAKAAAKAFVRMTPKEYTIAVTAFSNKVSVVCPMGNDRDQAVKAIGDMAATGGTALQDAIGEVLALLRGRTGRRLVLALTDGVENSSQTWQAADGKKRLLAEADADGTSVSVIGLGGDVNTSYLEEFQQTGGFYLFSPGEKELQERFQAVQESLRSEWQLRYTSPQRSVDGSRRPVVVRVLQGGTTMVTAAGQYVSPGLVPSVRGEHWPFAVALLLLAAAPRALVVIRTVLATQRFRNAHVQELPRGDKHVGRKDPNGGELAAGDPVVCCPSCTVPHHVRSWRLNRCKCMRDGLGTGRFCYHAALPAWLRKLLDRLTKGATGADGRNWLCRCAGDDEGY